jgi:hypothetical protein
MTVHYKQAGHDNESNINDRIQEMLNNLYGAPILTANPEITMDNELDNDGVLNPGEGFSVTYTFTNNSFETDALNAVASLTIDPGGIVASVSKELLVQVYVTENPSPGFKTPSLSSSLSIVISGFAVNIGAPYKLFSISWILSLILDSLSCPACL